MNDVGRNSDFILTTRIFDFIIIRICFPIKIACQMVLTVIPRRYSPQFIGLDVLLLTVSLHWCEATEINSDGFFGFSFSSHMGSEL